MSPTKVNVLVWLEESHDGEEWVLCGAANGSDGTSASIVYGGEISTSLLNARSRLDQFQSIEFRSMVLAHLESLVERFACKLLSLDVFDTILLRNEKCEMRRFFEMAKEFSQIYRLYKDVDPVDIFAARLIATRVAYRYSKPVKGCREGSLVEIHRGICEILDLPADAAEASIASELAYESANLEVNPLVEPIMLLAEEHGMEVVLISDMYMSGVHIAELVNESLNFPLERVYSSGDYKISKASGHLFEFVAARHGVSSWQAIHVGDSLVPDYVSAKRAFWNAIYLPQTDVELELIQRDERKFKEELLREGICLRLLNNVA